MNLTELLDAAGVEAELRGDGDAEIAGLAYDARQVGEGALFFCVRGMTSDGHQFAGEAVERGAVAVVVDHPLELGVPEVEVRDVRASMAPLAVAFWGDPTSELIVAGVTGTNGKTTTTFLIRHILEAAGRRCGLLGTVRRVVGGAVEEVERTTPEAIDLQAMFRRMLDRGDEACAMEVSSHALALNRTDGIHFDVKVFTNLTQDHLDFHADMEEYFAAKKLLFAAEGGAPLMELAGGVSVINVDDPYGQRLAGELGEGETGERVTFSAAGAEAEFSATEVSFDASGAAFRCRTPAGELEARIPLPGHFNVENALAGLAASYALGVDPRLAVDALASASRIPGRFEPIEETQPFAVVVDYAHTPDSLRNVLRAARRLTEGRLIAVFGCGGDRDRDKRPLMGRIGVEEADLAVITSDNPRSEEPLTIIDEILAGIEPEEPESGRHARTRSGGRAEVGRHARTRSGGRAEVVVEADRRAAIALALGRASAGDMVVIAGKGHEQGQEFAGGRKLPFDDRDVAREELRRLAAGAAR
jgi:UDP-N-acetylmuramoyl-L-alanyl-D-glutamate--2,6-diaminopimelate ligase